MSYFGKMKRCGARADLVFVDGNHDHEFALFDIQSAAQMINPCGFIVIDNIAQPGPFLAARQFMEQASSRGWHECGNSLSQFKEPFDRNRTAIHNTDFCVLRAPSTITVGSDPVSLGLMEWTNERELRLQRQGMATGRIHVQFIIRIFERPPREIIRSATVEFDDNSYIAIAIPELGPLERAARRTLEMWARWEGEGELCFRERPSIG
jgi:hypothetical protein